MNRIRTLGVILLVVVVAYTVAWFWAAGQITGYAKGLETADAVTTPRLKCGSFGVGGFPFGFDLSCTSATVTLADTTVTLSGLRLSAEVYSPTHVLASAQSPATVEDAFTGSKRRLDFVSAEGSARLTGWRIGRVSVIVEKPVWNDTVLDDRLIAKADHVEAHLVDLPAKYDSAKGQAALGEYAKIDNLDAPGLEIGAGNTVFEGEVTNLPDDVRTYGDADLLKRWQAAGGQFTLVNLKGEDTASGERFAATGNFNLDSQGRLGGQLKLNSKGLVERFGAAIPEQFKGLVVGGAAADGSYSQTVNIAAGVVFAGLVPAAVIPPLYEPAAP